MGLAPYGEPSYVGDIRSLVRLGSEGTFELDLSYFSHWSEGVAMTCRSSTPRSRRSTMTQPRLRLLCLWS